MEKSRRAIVKRAEELNIDFTEVNKGHFKLADAEFYKSQYRNMPELWSALHEHLDSLQSGQTDFSSGKSVAKENHGRGELYQPEPIVVSSGYTRTQDGYITGFCKWPGFKGQGHEVCSRQQRSPIDKPAPSCSCSCHKEEED